MGEQSAKNLRGKVATDIIFGGSASRKPLGMAEVTLVFDNLTPSSFCPPEYRHEPEVSLTRRLFADGAREYLINKKPARYKDIMNFFTLTGLGGRSYSMIQQGQVDRILNAKPEDVRTILEEAAGTLVFKARRDEALKKLNATRENLSRIDDILRELDRQEGHLKGQMEKAKRWQELSAEIKELELGLFAFIYANGSARQTVLETSVSDLETRDKACEQSAIDLELKQKEIQNALDVADPGLDGLREEVSSIRERIVRAESVIGSADDRIKQAQERLTQLNQELAVERESLQAVESQVREGREELSSVDQRDRDSREDIETLEGQLEELDENSSVFLSRVQDLEDALRSMDRHLSQNTVRCEAINRDRDRIHKEVESLEKEIEVLRLEIRDAERDHEKARSELESRQGGVAKDMQLKESCEKEIAEILERNRSLFAERDFLKEEYFQNKATLTSLENEIAQGEGTESIFRKLEDAGSSAQLVSDHVKFNERGAETYSARAAGC